MCVCEGSECIFMFTDARKKYLVVFVHFIACVKCLNKMIVFTKCVFIRWTGPLNVHFLQCAVGLNH